MEPGSAGSAAPAWRVAAAAGRAAALAAAAVSARPAVARQPAGGARLGQAAAEPVAASRSDRPAESRPAGAAAGQACRGGGPACPASAVGLPAERGRDRDSRSAAPAVGRRRWDAVLECPAALPAEPPQACPAAAARGPGSRAPAPTAAPVRRPPAPVACRAAGVETTPRPVARSAGRRRAASDVQRCRRNRCIETSSSGGRSFYFTVTVALV